MNLWTALLKLFFYVTFGLPFWPHFWASLLDVAFGRPFLDVTFRRTFWTSLLDASFDVTYGYNFWTSLFDVTFGHIC